MTAKVGDRKNEVGLLRAVMRRALPAIDVDCENYKANSESCSQLASSSGPNISI
jgi:hypothetical protein